MPEANAAITAAHAAFGWRGCQNTANNYAQNRPREENFRDATLAYYEACQGWWPRLCREFIGDGKLSLDQMAYSNCLPWRTASGTKFAEETAKRTAGRYAVPLIKELKPKTVIALYKRAADILERYGQPHEYELIAWNGAQAPREAVKRERKDTAQRILRRIGK